MRFAVLLYQDEDIWTHATAAEQDEYLQRHRAFAAAVAERGYPLTGEALTGVATATTVRRGEDGTSVTDGPFAETAEQFGGFYVIEAPHLDEVIELVEQLPPYTVEIRTIWELD